MADQEDNGTPKETNSGSTLTLNSLVGKKNPSHQVRQSFTQGRSKTVTVEVRKKRTLQRGISSKVEPVQTTVQPQSDAISHLSTKEQKAREKALQGSLEEAQNKEAEADIQPIVEKEVSIPDQSADGEEPSAPGLTFRERQVDLSYKSTNPVERIEASEDPVVTDEPISIVSEDTRKKEKKVVYGEDEKEGSSSTKKKVRRKEYGDEENIKVVLQRLDLNRLEEPLEETEEAVQSQTRRRAAPLPRRMRPHTRHQKSSQVKKEHQKVTREVIIPEFITVQELSNRMAIQGAQVVKMLMKMGMMVSMNEAIDGDTAELVVTEEGHIPKRVTASDSDLIDMPDDTKESLLPRPPVVTVMGHVDHGKTSLLDALRSTDVVAGEAGGITQHIGAYQITLGSGQKISFIDTPGHAAFSQMRLRGAQATDIVVLVVAADDGVKDQTVEAINHAKAANVPVVVAINKCDKPSANPKKIREELLSHEIVLEEFGGDVLAVEVSAKNKSGLAELEEAILLQAEILHLSANPDRPAEGVVVEARLEKGRGPVATVLIKRGTLNKSDVFVAGGHWGRVRSMHDDLGTVVTQALPSTPVEVIGFNSPPSAGDVLHVVESEEKAREIAQYRLHREKEARNLKTFGTSMEQMFSRVKMGGLKELPLLIKTDVQGSLEAIRTALEKLSTEEVAVKVIHGGVGGIHESDVTLASASKAIVVGFNVRANAQARQVADKDKTEIRYYSIIYDLLDDLKKTLGGMLKPELKETTLGYAEIREVFNITKVGIVAGCYVTEGTVKRGARVRLLRDNVVIHEGVLKTLRRFKDEVKEVKETYECGMAFENYSDIRVKDQIECFEVESIARHL